MRTFPGRCSPWDTCRGRGTRQTWGSPGAPSPDRWPLSHGHLAVLHPLLLPLKSIPHQQPELAHTHADRKLPDSYTAGRKNKHPPTHPPPNPPPSLASHFYTQQMLPTPLGTNSGHPSAPTLSS